MLFFESTIYLRLSFPFNLLLRCLLLLESTPRTHIVYFTEFLEKTLDIGIVLLCLTLNVDPKRQLKFDERIFRNKDLPLFAFITANPLLTITIISILRVMIDLEAVITELRIVKRLATSLAIGLRLCPTGMFNLSELMTKNLGHLRRGQWKLSLPFYRVETKEVAAVFLQGRRFIKLLSIKLSLKVFCINLTLPVQHSLIFI